MKLFLLRTGVFLAIIFFIYINLGNIFSFFGFPVNRFVKKDINKIVYAEPTQLVRDFDLEEYIDRLPDVEYTKIDFRIKEKYKYEFNNYVLEIDIPEDFEVYEIKLKKEPKVVHSTNIEDACEYQKATCFGPADGVYKDASIVSDKSLCVMDSKVHKKSEIVCEGLVTIVPHKSKFKGVSLRDIHINPHTKTMRREYNQKHITEQELSFAVYMGKNEWNKKIATMKLLSDNQSISISSNYGMDEYRKDKIVPKDLFFNILDSIVIYKKK